MRRVARRTISEHQFSESQSSASRNSRLIAEYNNLESSFEQSRMSFENDSGNYDRRNHRNNNSNSNSNSYSNSNHNSNHNSNLTNSQETLKNKNALRATQLEPTGHRLIDSSYHVPRPPRVRSFLNSSLRQRDRTRNQRESRLDSSDHSRQQNQLVSLPQPDIDSTQLGYLVYLNRHRGLSKPYQFAKHVMRRNRDMSVIQDFQKEHKRGFQQAKLRYMDNMAPKKLQVGNDPLRLYKYRQRKRDGYKLMELTQS